VGVCVCERESPTRHPPVGTIGTPASRSGSPGGSSLSATEIAQRNLDDKSSAPGARRLTVSMRGALPVYWCRLLRWMPVDHTYE
jgi:hypothetical protein